MLGQGEIDINQSVSINTTGERGYIDVEVSSQEEVCYEEEDVVCSQPVVPFEGMEFDSVEEARRVCNAYALKMGFSIRVASSRSSTVTKELIRMEFECNNARRPDSEQEDNTSASSRATNDVSKSKASKRKRSTKDVAQAKASKKKSSSAELTTVSKKCSTVKKYDCKAHMAVGLREGTGCVQSRIHTSLGEADWKKEAPKISSTHFTCRV